MGVPKNNLSKREDIAARILTGLFANLTFRVTFDESTKEEREQTHQRMIERSFEMADKFIEYSKNT